MIKDAAQWRGSCYYSYVQYGENTKYSIQYQSQSHTMVKKDRKYILKMAITMKVNTRLVNLYGFKT